MLERYLASLNHGQLVTLLHEAAQRDPGLRQRLELKAVTDSDQPPNQDQLIRHITAALRIDGFLDRDQTRDFADTLDELTARLLDLHHAGHGTVVIRAIRQALSVLCETFDAIDDPSGRVAAAAQALAALHARVCAEVMPDPVDLARWLLEFHSADPHWPYPELPDYIEPLGPAGLDWYGEHLTALWEEDATGDQGDRTRQHLEHYATLRDDVDLLVRVLRGHRPIGVRYGRIVEVLTTAGRNAEALTWAERGIASAETRVDHDLVDFVARQYTEAGRAADVCALRGAAFERSRSLHTYRRFRESAIAVGTWPGSRTWALDLLRPATDRAAGLAFQNHVLVEVLLWEEALDEAWSAAHRYGANTSQWEQLAMARASSAPDEAIAVYQRLIEQKVATRQKRAYGEAADLAVRLKDLHTRRGKDEAVAREETAAYLATLRETHRPKRAFLEELDRRGL